MWREKFETSQLKMEELILYYKESEDRMKSVRELYEDELERSGKLAGRLE